jgi:hypothetical protein
MKWLGSEVWSTLEVEYWVEKPWLLVFFRNGKRRGVLPVFLRNRRKMTKGGRGVRGWRRKGRRWRAGCTKCKPSIYRLKQTKNYVDLLHRCHLTYLKSNISLKLLIFGFCYMLDFKCIRNGIILEWAGS